MNESPELLEVVRRWVEKAENDLITAEHTLKLEETCPYDAICFHAQQCAEKYIKALLVFKWCDFPKTHDLVELTALLPPDSPLEIDVAELKRLSPYAVEARYPNEGEPLTRVQALGAVEIARKVRLAVRSKLPPFAVSRPGQ